MKSSGFIILILIVVIGYIATSGTSINAQSDILHIPIFFHEFRERINGSSNDTLDYSDAASSEAASEYRPKDQLPPCPEGSIDVTVTPIPYDNAPTCLAESILIEMGDEIPPGFGTEEGSSPFPPRVILEADGNSVEVPLPPMNYDRYLPEDQLPPCPESSVDAISTPIPYDSAPTCLAESILIEMGDEIPPGFGTEEGRGPFPPRPTSTPEM